MPDRDNTYSTNQIKKISQCHSSFGKRTRLASPKLDRWKDLNKAIIDWQNNDALDEFHDRMHRETVRQAVFQPIRLRLPDGA